MALTGSTVRPEGGLPPIVHDVLHGPGQPLDPTTRTFMESRFDADFSQVRVHADDRAAESAQVIDARAYTVGRDLVFGASAYAPSTQRGRELLAHELAHTVQQRHASGAPPSAAPDGRFESAARAAGRQAANGQMVSADLSPCGVGLSRAPAPHKSPVLDPRKKSWRKYARAEGRKDAARLRGRGQLSNEDRQEINAKLSYFEGQAHAAYLEEVRPALERVTGADVIEMPATTDTYVGKLPPAEVPDLLRRREHTLRYFRKLKPEKLQRHYTLVLQDYLSGDTRWDLDTLEQIVAERAPGARWHATARQEFLVNLQAREEARERERVISRSPAYWQNQMGALSEQTQSWPKEAQAIARDLLWKWFELRRKMSPADPSYAISGIEAGIEAAIRKDLVSQFEQVLRAAEKQVRAECEKNPPGWMERIHGDPCAPWFGSSLRRGTAALENFERRLNILRDEDGVPYRTVVFWIQEYMKQHVPTSMGGRYLELLQARSMLGSALTMAVRPMKLPNPPATSLTAPRVDVTGGKAFSAPLTPAPPRAVSAPPPSPPRVVPAAPPRVARPPAPHGVPPPPRPVSPVVAPPPPPRAVSTPPVAPAPVSSGRPATAPVVTNARAGSPPRVAAAGSSSRPPLSRWQRFFRDRWVSKVIGGLEATEAVPKIGAGRGSQPAITAKAPPPSPAPTPGPMPRVHMAGPIARPVGRTPSATARSGTVRSVANAQRAGLEATVRVTPTSPAATARGGGAPAPGQSLATISAARSATRPVVQGTGFTHDQILDLFVRHFKRPGPPQGTIVFHTSQASFDAAVQAAGLPAGTFGFFAHPTQPDAAPGSPGAMGLVHLPPTVSTLVTIHEALHMIGYQSGVIQLLGQYVEEGLTEWLARSLGPQTIRGLYDRNVEFVELLADVVGAETLRNAYLHRQWGPLRDALRARFGGDAAVQHFYRLLRRVGPHGERGGVLQEAIDMLSPSSAASPSPQVIGSGAPAPSPAAVRLGGSQQGAANVSAAGPRGARTPPRPQVLTGEAHARARQQWEDALLPLARQPAGGRIPEILIEGVYFNGVDVIRNGNRLLVGYFGIERRAAPSGAAAEVHEALEQAAFAIARQLRAESVLVFARTVVTEQWREFLLGRHYRGHVLPHTNRGVIGRRFTIPAYTISEDRPRQSPPSVGPKWSSVQDFGHSGIRWGTGEEAARNRLHALKQMGRKKAIRELEEAGITLNLAEKWRSHYDFEIYEAGVSNATARAREALMAYVVELLSLKAARR